MTAAHALTSQHDKAEALCSRAGTLVTLVDVAQGSARLDKSQICHIF